MTKESSPQPVDPGLLPPGPIRRTGGRSARVIHDVLTATVDELIRCGYAGLSIEAVANGAGVNRTTIYRRWPTKADLVRAAILAQTAARPAPPDTGALRTDLIAILGRNLGPQSERTLGLVRTFMGGIGDPELAAVARSIGDQHQEGVIAVVQRGVDRGELPPGTDPRRVVEPMIATCFLRVSMLGERPGLQDLERIVDLVLDGARSGAACQPGRSAGNG